MKKRSVIVAMLCSMCLAVSTPIPAMADASKVVTLGADLTDEQKNNNDELFQGRCEPGAGYQCYQPG